LISPPALTLPITAPHWFHVFTVILTSSAGSAQLSLYKNVYN
jgi:hypothetical protein